MQTILVHEHALKHGLTEDEVIHALRNAFAMGMRCNDDGSQDTLAVGSSQGGKIVEVVANETDDLVVIFHANSPVSRRMKVELNL